MSKKGFTLIELLAIIIILAVIAVITVPIILGIIDEAKKGAAKDSAHGYIKAINNYYYTNRFNNSEFNMQGNGYKINEDGYLVSSDNTITHQISFSGTIPNQGTIDINETGNINGCIVVNNYRFYIINNDISNNIQKDGNCNEAFTITFNTNGGNTINSITAIEGSTIELPTPTKTKDGFTFTFTGWFNEDGTEASNIAPGHDVTYYAHYQDLGAKFDSNIVNKIRTLTNNYMGNLQAVIKVDTIDSAHKIDANIVSASGVEKIYMWYENNNLYWYSLDDTPGFASNNIQYMFYYSRNLTDISGIASWDTSEITVMSGLFNEASSLTNIGPLANWNTSNVTDAELMFGGASSLTDISPLANWNVESLTLTSQMFSYTNIDNISSLTNWDTRSLTNIAKMFSNTENLSDATTLKWNTSNVCSSCYIYMFSGSGVTSTNKYPTFYSDNNKTQAINGTWNNGTFTPNN